MIQKPHIQRTIGEVSKKEIVDGADMQRAEKE
jgi:hypothetical protein